MAKRTTDGIDWGSYYQKEPEVCDFDPATNAAEMHRCRAALKELAQAAIQEPT